MTVIKRLRVSHVIVQPVLVWDDGDELEAGPQLNAIQLPASGLAAFAAQLPNQVAELAEQLNQSEPQQPEATPQSPG